MAIFFLKKSPRQLYQKEYLSKGRRAKCLRNWRASGGFVWTTNVSIEPRASNVMTRVHVRESVPIIMRFLCSEVEHFRAVAQVWPPRVAILSKVVFQCQLLASGRLCPCRSYHLRQVAVCQIFMTTPVHHCTI